MTSSEESTDRVPQLFVALAVLAAAAVAIIVSDPASLRAAIDAFWFMMKPAGVILPALLMLAAVVAVLMAGYWVFVTKVVSEDAHE